ncbi:MAG: RlmE family RNA methyltransferase, partial [Pseudohongiellaceae bacterium]
MSKSKSSKQWLQEHFDDAFVKRSRQDGYRSRASYKLLALHEKDRLFRPGMVVVDLGAAPGGWTQVAVALVKPGGLVIASDILPMEPVTDAAFIQGDFTTDEGLQAVMETLAGREADLVISDMAPNMSGMAEIDQPRAVYLVELAMDFARQTLK